MSRFLRWILVAPVSLAGYFIALFLGMGVIMIAETLCPAQYLISETCFAPYMQPVKTVSLLFFPALAAVLVVLLPCITAPSYKFLTACIVYMTGAGVAIYMGLSTGAYTSLFATLISGALMLYVVYRTTASRKI